VSLYCKYDIYWTLPPTLNFFNKWEFKIASLVSLMVLTMILLFIYNQTVLIQL
jgi:hypothetical protein